MDFRRLRYFYTIAQEGQITKAAKVLHMAQPPLSQSLKLLEEELGVELFERVGRKMELTDAGKVLYIRLEKLFHQLEETITEVKDTGLGYQGTLSIGSTKTCFSYLIKPMKRFQKMYPDIRFELREGDSSFLAEQLAERDIDLALVRLPLDLDPFAHISLPDEKYVLALPRHWIPNPSQSAIAIEDIGEYPLMLLHRISGIGQYEVILEAFDKRGLNPKIICECPDVDMLLGLVSEGFGATIIPESTWMKPYDKRIKVLEIENASIISKSALIWLKDRYLSKSAARFIEMFFEDKTISPSMAD